MRALFIIDPIGGLKPYKDSSIDLMAVAQARGHEVAVCEMKDVFAGTDGVMATVTPVELGADVRGHKTMDGAPVTLGTPEKVKLDTFGAIFIRPDPPFGMEYLSLCLLLDPLVGKVAFVNSPRGLRVVSEKLSALLFPDASPKTMAGYRAEDIRAFAKKHEKVVLKPAYFGGGEGVTLASSEDADFDAKVQAILNTLPHGPVIAQEFMPEVADGDTRVMIVNGEPVGAVGRKPAAGEFRANIAAGGSEFAAELTPAQRGISERVGAFLVRQGILFGGLDFIGSKLIEINVTSPTLIQQLRRLGGGDVSESIWQAIEAGQGRVQ